MPGVVEFTINANRRALMIGTVAVNLSYLEFALIERVFQAGGAVVSYPAIVAAMWHPDRCPRDRDRQMRLRLHYAREKLASAGLQGWLETRSGLGLRRNIEFELKYEPPEH